MHRDLILKEFKNSAVVDASGGVRVTASKFSRAAIVAAFQLNGGLEGFADWAKANHGEFYTKLFPKIIGKETVGDENKYPDDVEALLETIDDVEFEDITEQVEAEVEQVKKPIGMRERLAKKGTAYSSSEEFS